MGCDTFEVSTEIGVSALIVFEGDFNSSPMDIRVSEFTLLDVPYIDFGDVEPFRDDWYDE